MCIRDRSDLEESEFPEIDNPDDEFASYSLLADARGKVAPYLNQLPYLVAIHRLEGQLDPVHLFVDENEKTCTWLEALQFSSIVRNIDPARRESDGFPTSGHLIFAEIVPNCELKLSTVRQTGNGSWREVPATGVAWR